MDAQLPLDQIYFHLFPLSWCLSQLPTLPHAHIFDSCGHRYAHIGCITISSPKHKSTYQYVGIAEASLGHVRGDAELAQSAQLAKSFSHTSQFTVVNKVLIITKWGNLLAFYGILTEEPNEADCWSPWTASVACCEVLNAPQVAQKFCSFDYL